MIISKIRDYFTKCPILKKESPLGIDYLEEEATSYSIEPTPSDIIYREYVDGDSLRQYQFTIATREEFGVDAEGQARNQNFFVEMVDWLDEQNDKGNLPKLEKGRRSQFIEVMTGGYVFNTSGTKAKYQMQLRLVYSQEKGGM